MDEFSFIQQIQDPTYRQPFIQKGIGDDAAVLKVNQKSIVTAVDTYVEGVHFSKETMDYDAVGYRVLAANLSDLAAMGAKPIAYLVSIVVPSYLSEKSLFEIYKGMKRLAKTFKIDLIGGDTVKGKELTISVTIFGVAFNHKIRYRHLAEAGDIIFVTGTLGDSKAGLSFLLNEINHLEDKDYFMNRHRYPIPRVDFAQSLQSIDRICLNDVSDGIASELNEIAKASNVKIKIDFDRLPIHPSLKHIEEKLKRSWILFGGEDFELLGTVSLANWEKIKQKAKKIRLQIRRIGTVHRKKRDEDFVYLKENESFLPLLPKGYNHLQ